jgi:hypothetical protein
VLLGNGNGTFQPVVLYDTGGADAQSVVAADVNRDGKPDLVVANADTNGTDRGSIGVLLGKGDGTFQPAVIYDSGGIGASAIAVADLNGDGKPDVSVTNIFDTTVGVLLGNGDGTFLPVVTYDSGGSTPASIATSDVNNDHRLDLAVAECAIPNCGSQTTDQVGVLLHVGAIRTTTTLASLLNPSVFGQLVTFTATVTSSSGTPTGTVVFFDSSTELGTATLANGIAAVSTSNLVAASHPVTAVYQGSLKYNSSASSSLNQVVTIAMTATSLMSSRNPSPVMQAVSYTATVTSSYGGGATGTVTFSDGSSAVSTVSVTGNKATFSQKYLVVGTHAIIATYSGDASNLGSSSATLMEHIEDPSATALVTSGSPSFVGQPVTFTAMVTSKYGPIPDGELVTFYDGSTALVSLALAGGKAAYPTSVLSARTHYLKATYAGDTTFLPSTGRVTQIVVKYPTTTSLTSSPNPSTYGQPVTFTATVTSAGPRPMGKVWFKDETTGIGTVTLSGNVATLTKSNLAVGTHPITAQYLGDSASAKSTSAVLNQVVQ